VNLTRRRRRQILTKRICPNFALLAAGQGIVAIWNVFPAENAGHAGVNGQTQPLAGLVMRVKFGTGGVL
jgi:hypothetical protein